jgi:glycosyltransferase involved in cell wall biosynthesis
VGGCSSAHLTSSPLRLNMDALQANTNEHPVVSVVTITRNNLHGLAKTRASVLAQTFAHIEHVIVDASSIDGTVEWLAAQNPDIRWVSEADAGRYDGMNKGARRATCRLLWFMHSGDTFAGDQSIRTVAQDWRMRHWKWAYGAARIVDGAGDVRSVNAPIPFRFRHFWLGREILPHQAAVFESAFFHELGGYDVDFGLEADQLFMLRAALASRPATIAEFLCDFDVHGAGSQRSALAHYRDSARGRRKTNTLVRGSGIVDGCVFLALLASEHGMRAVSRWLQETP